jgi:hypothetical protein
MTRAGSTEGKKTTTAAGFDTQSGHSKSRTQAARNHSAEKAVSVPIISPYLPGAFSSYPISAMAGHTAPAAFHQRMRGRPPGPARRVPPMIRTFGLLAERLFRELADKAVRRRSFNSAEKLIDKIHIFINYHHNSQKVCVWTAEAEDMAAKAEQSRSRAVRSQQTVRERYQQKHGLSAKGRSHAEAESYRQYAIKIIPNLFKKDN